MRGLGDMMENDRKEVLRVYKNARALGDKGLQTTLREAHTVWAADFDRADSEIVEGSKRYA